MLRLWGEKMIIRSIKVHNEGYVYCKSNFYCAQDILSNDLKYTFSTGVNELVGEIDSGNWAISYLLSMYKYSSDDFVLFEQPKLILNDEVVSLSDFSTLSCYMDKLYPLFSNNDSVRNLVSKGLEYSKLNNCSDDIKKMFCIDDERFERPLTGVGNEIFRAMAAIGYSYKKEIYCFPWLSNYRFESYRENLGDLLEMLKNLGKIVILPVGKK